CEQRRQGEPSYNPFTWQASLLECCEEISTARWELHWQRLGQHHREGQTPFGRPLAGEIVPAGQFDAIGVLPEQCETTPRLPGGARSIGPNNDRPLIEIGGMMRRLKGAFEWVHVVDR